MMSELTVVNETQHQLDISYQQEQFTGEMTIFIRSGNDEMTPEIESLNARLYLNNECLMLLQKKINAAIKRLENVHYYGVEHKDIKEVLEILKGES
jgi:hypothetical protein